MAFEVVACQRQDCDRPAAELSDFCEECALDSSFLCPLCIADLTLNDRFIGFGFAFASCFFCDTCSRAFCEGHFEENYDVESATCPYCKNDIGDEIG